MARRLDACEWLRGLRARISGNAFAVSLTQIDSAEEAASLAERVRLELAKPYRAGDQQFHLTASVGISVYPNDASLASVLMANAESAMYHAKEQGRDQYRFYSQSLGAAVTSRIELERDLRAALERRQFELYYQPKIHACEQRVVGVEALIRWNRAGHGLVSPAEFIPLAEQIGLIVQLGEWVIEEACRQLREWFHQGLGHLTVAVNLSPSQLDSPTLVERVDALMRRHEVGADRLEIEVTESMMMADPEQAIARLRALRKLGVKLSIDDFGTGYSSMAYLKRLPVEALKLDRSFIHQIVTDSRDVDICAGVIALAHKLGLSVVAEGVETTEQHQLLLAQGCDVFQGYLFSRPLPTPEATSYLLRRSEPSYPESA